MSFLIRYSAWSQRHAFLLDLIGAAAAMVVFGGLYALVFFGSLTSEADRHLVDILVGAVLTLFMFGTLGWRRRNPGIAMWALTGLCLVSLLLETPAAGAIAVPFMIYAVAAYGKRWEGRVALILGMIGAVLMTAKSTAADLANLEALDSTSKANAVQYVFTSLISLSLLVLFAWTLGALTRNRRLRIRELEDRARRLEVENQQERELAAADERAHIAREMHDIVAHSLSVIITQADGGRYAAVNDPEQGRKALETIAATGRGSLAEMRRLLGILRTEEDTDYRPQPGLEDIPELVETTRRHGLNVGLITEGQARSTLPSGAGLTAYRVVQEGMTNAMKHAGPRAVVSVRLAWEPRGLSIAVHDDGRGAAAEKPTAGGGKGLRGMRERVALYDGNITAGPRAGGGFGVDVLIPYSEA